MNREGSTNRQAVEDRFADLNLSALTRVERQTLVRLALACLAQRHRAKRKLRDANDTQAYLRLRLADCKHEVFGCVFLDCRHRIIEVAELFNGTISGATVHARVVVQRALAVNAAEVIFFYNHPSGVAEPSCADEAITRKLIDALALVEIRVLDHFVVTDTESVSFAERGLL